MKKIFFIFFILNFIMFACQNADDKDIIEEKKFEKILTDLHILDGILNAKNLQNKFKKKKKLTSPYNFVFKKHNVSRIEFEKTVDYYTFRSDEYKIIYKAVIKNISELKKEIEETEERKKTENDNLWEDETEWHLPEDGKTKAIVFKIKTKENGIFTLSANIRMYKDDRSVNQRMTIIANYEDETKDINTRTIVKDGKYNNYKVSVTTDKNKILKNISGWVLDHSKGTGNKHADVKNITLKRKKYENEKSKR